MTWASLSGFGMTRRHAHSVEPVRRIVGSVALGRQIAVQHSDRGDLTGDRRASLRSMHGDRRRIGSDRPVPTENGDRSRSIEPPRGSASGRVDRPRWCCGCDPVRSSSTRGTPRPRAVARRRSPPLAHSHGSARSATTTRSGVADRWPAARPRSSRRRSRRHRSSRGHRRAARGAAPSPVPPARGGRVRPACSRSPGRSSTPSRSCRARAACRAGATSSAAASPASSTSSRRTGHLGRLAGDVAHPGRDLDHVALVRRAVLADQHHRRQALRRRTRAARPPTAPGDRTMSRRNRSPLGDSNSATTTFQTYP